MLVEDPKDELGKISFSSSFLFFCFLFFISVLEAYYRNPMLQAEVFKSLGHFSALLKLLAILDSRICAFNFSEAF